MAEGIQILAEHIENDLGQLPEDKQQEVKKIEEQKIALLRNLAGQMEPLDNAESAIWENLADYL
jgi:hypothetical protein